MEKHLPPQDLDAEMAILGAVLIDNRAYKNIDIPPEAFYRASHRLIWEKMGELSAKGAPIDLVTLREVIGHKDMQRSGGVAYHASLLSATPTAANIKHHADIIMDKYIRRTMIIACRQIIDDAHDGNVETLITQFRDKLTSGIMATGAGKIVTAHDVAQSAMAEMGKRNELWKRDRNAIGGIPTGLSELDFTLDGFNPGELTILGGRPGMGKSILALQFAWFASQQRKVHVISIEMRPEELVKRAVSSLSGIESTRIRKGSIETRDGWDRIITALGKVSTSKLTFGVCKNSLGSIRKNISVAIARGAELIIVDYLQLIALDEHGSSAEQKVNKITDGLKSLAKETLVPIMIVTALSRANERDGIRPPALSDLKYGGEYSADNVLLLHRPGCYQKENDEKPGDTGFAMLIIAKNRNGEAGGLIKLFFNSNVLRFETWI